MENPQRFSFFYDKKIYNFGNVDTTGSINNDHSWPGLRIKMSDIYSCPITLFFLQRINAKAKKINESMQEINAKGKGIDEIGLRIGTKSEKINK